jgi:hypothetical protein
MLFYGTQIDDNRSGTPGVHLGQFVGHVLVFIRHAAVVLQALGYSGPILVEATLSSVLGVPWLQAPQGMLFSHSGSELDDDVSFLVTKTTEALLEKADGVAIDVVRTVFFSVNWSDLVDKPQKLEDLVLQGYRFNLWSLPDNSVFEQSDVTYPYGGHTALVTWSLEATSQKPG